MKRFGFSLACVLITATLNLEALFAQSDIVHERFVDSRRGVRISILMEPRGEHVRYNLLLTIPHYGTVSRYRSCGVSFDGSRHEVFHAGPASYGGFLPRAAVRRLMRIPTRPRD